MSNFRTKVISKREIKRALLIVGVALLTITVIGLSKGGYLARQLPDVKNDKTAADEELDAQVIAVADAKRWYKQSCSLCHGEALEGKMDNPALLDLGERYTSDEIYQIIVNGKQNMPGGFLQGTEAQAVAEWLIEVQR